MATLRESLAFRVNHYDITIIPITQRTLALTIIDTIFKVQYHEKELNLELIGVSTLIKAFDHTKKQISFQITQKKGAQNQVLQIKVNVHSQFLKSVQQVILIKKTRDVTEAQVLKKAMEHISRKVKSLKQDQKVNQNIMYGSIREKQQVFNGSSNYECYSEIKLPKGKYIITWSFLAKASNSLMYVYLNKNVIPLITNCYIYMPLGTSFIPLTLQKQYQVKLQEQTLLLQTYYSVSYPVTIRNCLTTAKKLT